MAMDATSKKAYIIAIIIQLIYTGTPVMSKAAFDDGMNTFIFVFYRQAAGSLILLPLALLLQRKNLRSTPLVLLLKLFLCALIGNTLVLNVYNVSLKFTSPTVASATNSSMPVLTFCLALLMRMEVVKVRSSSGIAKVAGVALCLTGVLVIAFYTGPALLNNHHDFAPHASGSGVHTNASESTWIKGTFLFILGNMAWSLSIVWQAALLREYPNKMLVAVALCLSSAVQSFVVAAVAEKEFSMWKLQPDICLLAIIYTGFVVTGVSYYLQAWCIEMKGPVFFGVWSPLCFVFTMFCSYFMGEIVHLGSILGGILLTGRLYSVLWGKSKESKIVLCAEVNMIEGAQDGQERNKPDEEKREEAASASPVEQV